MSHHQRQAFTILELIIALSIVLTLCALGTLAYQSAVGYSRRTAEVAALRRVTQAYLTATADQQGVLPLGFDEVNPVAAIDFPFPDGETLLKKANNIAVVVQRLPWRLAPYLDYSVERSMITWANKSAFATNPSGHYYALSIAPAFGLNAFCVGGYGGGSRSVDLASRLAQVPEPSKMVAFSTASMFYIKPPNMRRSVFDSNNPGWTRQEDEGQPARREDASAYGNIRFEYNGKAIVSFLDGHVEMKTPQELRDSRLWSRLAQSADDSGRAIHR